MPELNITKMLHTLEAAGIGLLEWSFEEKKLVMYPGLLSILEEPEKPNCSKLSFLWKRLHTADRQLIRSSLLSQVEAISPVDIEFRLRNKNKNFVWVRAQSHIETDVTGTPTSLIVLIHNISKQHGIEQELKTAEQRLKQTLECANIGPWQMFADYSGPQVKRQFWCADSCYSILGFESHGQLDSLEKIFDLMHASDREQTQKLMQAIIENNDTPIDLQFRLLHQTKGYTWFRCIAKREQVTDKLFKATGAIIDINDLKLAQQDAKIKNRELEQSNEELEHFAYAASHDLRAPLRGLKNLTTWIREDLENPPESIKQNLRLMSSRVERMENLLSDILAYSRAGRRNKEPEEIDLQKLIEEVWDCIYHPEGFTLQLNLQVSSLIASSTLLQQIFSNLISNAIKHHDREQGNIRIRYHLENEQHRFFVEDDGPGIDPKFQDKIFQIFQTLKSRDEVEGSGVGLAIVKRSIQSVGGTVWVESQKDSRGSCFHFTLPV